MNKFFLNIFLSILLSISFVAPQAFSAESNSLEKSACLDEDGKENDQPWELLEKSIPACRRAIVILQLGAVLDLGTTRVVKDYPNGMTSLKVKVVTGKGSYDVDDKIHSLNGVTLWLSLDRCQMRNLIFTDENKNDVAFKKARYFETTEEVSAIADGNEFKNYKNDCSAK